LFGFNKSQTTSIRQPKEKSAMEVIKDTILIPSPVINTNTHLSKIQTLKQFELECMWNKQKLINAGFRAFIKSDWINNFKYHAQVYSHSNSSLLDTVYVGDIPEFVLDKALIAKECGLKFITIHSNYPLPTEFIHCDPVLIGWNNYIKTRDGFIRTNKHGQLYTPAISNIEGVILAVWDYDKESEIL
jgi:hypothetical protein